MRRRPDLEPRSKRSELIRRIVAATRQDGGAAVRLDTGQFLPPVDIWAFPKYPGRTVILPAGFDLEAGLQDFIEENEPHLNEADCWLGTWVHPQTGEFYLDIATACSDLEEAIQQAREAGLRDGRSIVSIYNAMRRQTVFL